MNRIKDVLLAAAETRVSAAIRILRCSKTLQDILLSAKGVIKECERGEAIENVFAYADIWKRPIRLHFQENSRLRNEPLNLTTARFAVTQRCAAICVEDYTGAFFGASLEGLDLSKLSSPVSPSLEPVWEELQTVYYPYGREVCKGYLCKTSSGLLYVRSTDGVCFDKEMWRRTHKEAQKLADKW